MHAEINEIELQLSKIAKELQNITINHTIDPVNIVLYNEELSIDINYEEALLKVQTNLDDSKNKLEEFTSRIDKNKDQEKEIENLIKECFTKNYRYFDKDDDAQIKDIFTKSSEIYSGSENTYFLLADLWRLKRF